VWYAKPGMVTWRCGSQVAGTVADAMELIYATNGQWT
jgi:hypothetical protein